MKLPNGRGRSEVGGVGSMIEEVQYRNPLPNWISLEDLTQNVLNELKHVREKACRRVSIKKGPFSD